ncbi:hypothetical protein MWN33_15170 [Starkeya koreensis]|uniref:Uncharacterized protein n=2 Tax=Ancylobacter koreensis TaxID=266121 RepID=A0ABT0DQ35_9HYPH|nr:hypothetical protein [Ancylobacter koreensis]
MEYDYAIECGIPVLGFVNGNTDGITFDKTEKGDEVRLKLDKFRSKVLSRTCRKCANSSDLGKEVMKSLVSETRIRPRIGWVRADQARSIDDVNREKRLTDDLAAAEREIDELSRALRDGAVLGDEIDVRELAQGGDLYPFNVGYMSSEKKIVFELVYVRWNEIFSSIGPSMYGYILRNSVSSHDARPTYIFESSLIHLIRSKIFDKVQNRRVDISPSQIDDIVIHLKELGLVKFSENKDEDSFFRGITLTERGERELSRLKIVRR